MASLTSQAESEIENIDENENGYVSSTSSSSILSNMGRITIRRNVLQGESEEDENLIENNKICMAVVWVSGKLGLAYFEPETSELSILPDIPESTEFTLFKTIYEQIKPKILIASERQDQRFIKFLRELCGANIVQQEHDNASKPSTSISSSGLPSSYSAFEESTKLIITPGREFAPDPCKARIFEIHLPWENENLSENEHLIFLSSIIPFNSNVMIRATGALLKFLDKKGFEFQTLRQESGKTQILNIKLAKIDDIVIVEDSAWEGLKIFDLESHPSAKKFGTAAGTKEGLSLYSLLNRCITIQGGKFLKSMLRRPSRDKNLIIRRQDIVNFFMDQCNSDYIGTANECLKSIKSFPKILYKLNVLHSSVRDWKDIQRSVYHAIMLGEFCSSFNYELFNEITSLTKSENFRAISMEITRIIDFEESETKGHIVSNPGVDEELDILKRKFLCLPDIMSMVATEEMSQLPDFVSQATVVFLPEIGYLLSLTFKPDVLEEELESLKSHGLEYQFAAMEMTYYKSPRMKELDIIMGDCQVAILDKEISIVVHLTSFILRFSNLFYKLEHLVAELDCLICFAKVAKNQNYTRPTIIDNDERMEIIDGRHPLSEFICEFVPNTTKFFDGEKVVILTGPNASGKSIYLKQVGVIVLMALCGSFVPASFAKIPTFEKIFTRIHVHESVSSGLSTFTVDLSKMSLALRESNKNTLLLIDEFGKGTAEADGLSLLTASLDDFIKRTDNCPIIFLSTHFYSIIEYLEQSPLVKYQSMEFIEQENSIIYLYKIKNGACSSSFAHIVGRNVGVTETVIERSKKLENIIKNQLSEDDVEPNEFLIESQSSVIKLAEEFFQLDLLSMDDEDLKSFCEKLQSI